jgi:hypothetical protein
MSQPARRCIGELPDIRTDSGAGVDDPFFPAGSTTARRLLPFHCIHIISNFIESLWAAQGYIPCYFILI